MMPLLWKLRVLDKSVYGWLDMVNLTGIKV